MNIGGGATGAPGAWRADPLRLGLAALLLLLIALVGVAIAMLATPPPREVAATAPAAPVVSAPVSAELPTASPMAPVAAVAPKSRAEGAGASISGPAQIADTATLRVGDRIVTLQGVLGDAGAEARAMAEWLAGREVRCERVAAQFHRCVVDGWDLAEVVLFNGGGRAAPDASPAQRKAERQARDARRGVWAAR